MTFLSHSKRTAGRYRSDVEPDTACERLCGAPRTDSGTGRGGGRAGGVVRRTLVNLFVAATSLAVLAGSWFGVSRADESRRAREAAEQDSTALAEAIRSSGGDPASSAPVVATSTPAGTTGPTAAQPVPTATSSPTAAPTSTAVAGATATPPRATATAAAASSPTAPAPGLIPAPTATPALTPTAVPTASATPSVTATPRRIIRPSRAS